MLKEPQIYEEFQFFCFHSQFDFDSVSTIGWSVKDSS